MTKAKAYSIFVAAIVVNLFAGNVSFAIESSETKNKYTDYSYEFNGKDKFENFNRKVFTFNLKLNKYLIRPVNIVWASVMPKYGLERLDNFYNNIEFPMRFTSCLLQRDFKGSGKETLRFLTNTTIGLGGLFDPAKNHFKIEPREENMEQVLAHYKVKKGPYLVLPFIAPANIRGFAGKLLDIPLNPSSYIVSPIIMMAKAGSIVNKTTCSQSLYKTIETTYADPYDIAKTMYGIESYIKTANLDRKENLVQDTTTQNVVPINSVYSESDVKADINLNDYNPQTPRIDAMRTALFDDSQLSKSAWSEISIWNRSFSNRIKTGSIKMDKEHPDYKYRYILQKNKTSPLAIIYPSIGEGVKSHHAVVMAKMFYDNGYSVVIQGSNFQWEFVKSMPNKYRPGVPSQDADYARIVSAKILNDLEKEKGYKFKTKMLVGTSFGALTTLFVAAKEETDNTLGITNYISICPPIELLFAIEEVDKNFEMMTKNPSDVKSAAAITAQKLVKLSQNLSDKNTSQATEFPIFSDDEARLVSGFIMKQKLTDLILTIENVPKIKKSDLYKTINNMSFHDYAQKYLTDSNCTSCNQLGNNANLYALSDFLQKNNKYKIYHAADDYYVNSKQLSWLKKQSANKTIVFDHGSHLGFLYRKEFLDEFKKDIITQDKPAKNPL